MFTLEPVTTPYWIFKLTIIKGISKHFVNLTPSHWFATKVAVRMRTIAKFIIESSEDLRWIGGSSKHEILSLADEWEVNWVDSDSLIAFGGGRIVLVARL